MGSSESKTEVVQQPVKVSEVQTYIMITNIKLTQQRNKKVFDIKKKREEVVNYLKDNNIEMAKLKVESIFRNEDYISSYDILATLCELIKEKITYIFSFGSCPEDMRAAIETLIYASTRLEIEELHKLREILKRKYGEIFVQEAISNKYGLVNKNIEKQLSVLPYNASILTARLKEIGKEENINVDFPEEIIAPIRDFSNPFVNDGMNNMNFGNYPGLPSNGNNFNQQGQILEQVGYPNTPNNPSIYPNLYPQPFDNFNVRNNFINPNIGGYNMNNNNMGFPMNNQNMNNFQGQPLFSAQGQTQVDNNFPTPKN